MKRTWTLTPEDVVSARSEFGGTVLIACSGRSLGEHVAGGEAKSVSVALSGARHATVTIFRILGSSPDAELAIEGRFVPDDTEAGRYACLECGTRLGPFDASCVACGKLAHDHRAKANRERLETARGVLWTIALAMLAITVLPLVDRLRSIHAAELIPGVVPALGMVGLAGASHAKPVAAFTLGLFAYIGLNVWWFTSGDFDVDQDTAFAGVVVCIALYHGLKAALAFERRLG